MSLINRLAYASLIFNIVMLLLVVILPRPLTKPLRRRLAPLIMWIWVTDSRVWAKIYTDIWMEGNGHH